ncbi:AAA family ATPase [Nostoc sp. FACHB-152]|uniref:AAA family ATPase n=1 Tax=unclassified Nostoc TaxID=2593658 RepID=UPI001687D0AC|nr:MULTISPECIES: AAA family ATPase [unclassified Nostoc]MBD2450277.1 AAA family ATPase [Nostoc sp. FACHB-152]MBD2471457.1 AAA family ATPase [Nostoc sp. FACHB-145]
MPFNPELCRNESEVESKLIVQYLLPQLGYTPDTWHQEVAVGSIRLDFLAFAAQVLPFVIDANSPLSVVMEAKHPKQNLNNHFLRLRHYLTSLNVKYGLLTNGKEIRIYEKLADDIRLVFLCSGKEVETKIEEIKSFIGRDTLKDKEPLDKTEPLVVPDSYKGEIKEKHSMKIIAVYHNKGGVGKTTTVVNLAAAIRKKGKRVLVIDLDSQANTTFATGLVKFDDEISDNIKDNYVYHILRSVELDTITEVARKSVFTNPEIDIIPSHINLMKMERELNELRSSHTRLINKLKEVQDKYDIVIIDTPPSLNLFAFIALITSDYLIIPSDLKPFANQGLINVKEYIKYEVNQFRSSLNKPPLTILGVLACKIATFPKFVQHTLPKQIAAISQRYDLPVLDTVIYQREELAKCLEQVQQIGDLEVPDPRSVFEYKPHGDSAKEFELLAIEVLQKTGI